MKAIVGQVVLYALLLWGMCLFFKHLPAISTYLGNELSRPQIEQDQRTLDDANRLFGPKPVGSRSR